MKRLQLPKNKLARLAINIASIYIWLIISGNIWVWIKEWAFRNRSDFYESWTFYDFWTGSDLTGGLPLISSGLLILLPMGLVTRYIWWGRKPRITRSREEEQAGKKWDSVVDELRNRK